jgi:hypothetical protein
MSVKGLLSHPYESAVESKDNRNIPVQWRLLRQYTAARFENLLLVLGSFYL